VFGHIQAFFDSSSSSSNMTYLHPYVNSCSASEHASRAALKPLLFLTLLVSYAAATPQQYVSRVATTDCSKHPDKAYGRHGKPVPDVRSSFTFVRLDDNTSSADAPVLASQGSSIHSSRSQQQITVMSADAVTAGADSESATPRSSPLALCAGYSYALDVNFGGSLVNALVSSSAGRLLTDQRPGALEAVTDTAEALGLLNLYREDW
jgi:hypothetical protein